MSHVQESDFQRLMQQFVLTPAGMARSSFAHPQPDANFAHGHAADGKPIAGGFHVYPELAVAGLWTTPSDIARFAIQLQRSARGAGGGLLSPAVAGEMLKLHSGSYGLGFGVGGEGPSRFFVHPGGNEGFRAFLIAFAEAGSGAVVTTNSDNGMQLAFEILRAIARVYDRPKTGLSSVEPVEKRSVAIETSELRHFTGEYKPAEANAGLISVTLAGDALQVRLQGWPTARPAYASGKANFSFLDAPVELIFEGEESGRAAARVITGNGQRRRANRMWATGGRGGTGSTALLLRMPARPPVPRHSWCEQNPLTARSSSPNFACSPELFQKWLRLLLVTSGYPGQTTVAEARPQETVRQTC